ncbi:hypothetical protein MRX96_053310, partial [Rhipicephalus microplus]
TYAGILREEKLPKLKSEVQRLADETNNMAAAYNTLEEVKKNHIELFPQARKMFLNTPKIDYYVSKRYFDTLKKSDHKTQPDTLALDEAEMECQDSVAGDGITHQDNKVIDRTSGGEVRDDYGGSQVVITIP